LKGNRQQGNLIRLLLYLFKILKVNCPRGFIFYGCEIKSLVLREKLVMKICEERMRSRICRQRRL
jgi:hypothetical protein